MASNDDLGKLHELGIIIPYMGKEDDQWIEFAREQLFTRYDLVDVGGGLGRRVKDGIALEFPIVVIAAYTPPLRDFDLTFVCGLGLRVFWGLDERPEIAIFADNDILTF